MAGLFRGKENQNLQEQPDPSPGRSQDLASTPALRFKLLPFWPLLPFNDVNILTSCNHPLTSDGYTGLRPGVSV